MEPSRTPLRGTLTLLAAAAALLAGCAGAPRAPQPPALSLGGFGRVVVDPFSDQGFLNSLKGTPRYAPYVPAANHADAAVRWSAQSRLVGFQGSPGGPALFLDATLVRFATGSGATRALAWFNLVPQGVGDGVIAYRVTLHTADGHLVAAYTVRRAIDLGAEEAYRRTGYDIAAFVLNHP